METEHGATFVEYVVVLILLGLVLLGASQLLTQSSKNIHNQAVNDLNTVGYKPFTAP